MVQPLSSRMMSGRNMPMWRRTNRHRPRANRGRGQPFALHGLGGPRLGPGSSFRTPFGATGLNPNSPLVAQRLGVFRPPPPKHPQKGVLTRHPAASWLGPNGFGMAANTTTTTITAATLGVGNRESSNSSGPRSGGSSNSNRSYSSGNSRNNSNNRNNHSNSGDSRNNNNQNFSNSYSTTSRSAAHLIIASSVAPAAAFGATTASFASAAAASATSADSPFQTHGQASFNQDAEDEDEDLGGLRKHKQKPGRTAKQPGHDADAGAGRRGRGWLPSSRVTFSPFAMPSSELWKDRAEEEDAGHSTSSKSKSGRGRVTAEGPVPGRVLEFMQRVCDSPGLGGGGGGSSASSSSPSMFSSGSLVSDSEFLRPLHQWPVPMLSLTLFHPGLRIIGEHPRLDQEAQAETGTETETANRVGGKSSMHGAKASSTKSPHKFATASASATASATSSSSTTDSTTPIIPGFARLLNGPLRMVLPHTSRLQLLPQSTLVYLPWLEDPPFPTHPPMAKREWPLITTQMLGQLQRVADELARAVGQTAALRYTTVQEQPNATASVSGKTGKSATVATSETTTKTPHATATPTPTTKQEQNDLKQETKHISRIKTQEHTPDAGETKSGTKTAATPSSGVAEAAVKAQQPDEPRQQQQTHSINADAAQHQKTSQSKHTDSTPAQSQSQTAAQQAQQHHRYDWISGPSHWSNSAALNVLAMLLVLRPEIRQVYCLSQHRPGGGFYGFLKDERRVVRLLDNTLLPGMGDSQEGTGMSHTLDIEELAAQFPGLRDPGSVLLVDPYPMDAVERAREIGETLRGGCRIVAPVVAASDALEEPYSGEGVSSGSGMVNVVEMTPTRLIQHAQVLVWAMLMPWVLGIGIAMMLIAGVWSWIREGRHH